MRITERRLRSIIKNVIKETYSPEELEDLRGTPIVDKLHPDHRLKNDPHNYEISDYNEDLANQLKWMDELKVLYREECYQGSCTHEDFKNITRVIELCRLLNLNCDDLLEYFAIKMQKNDY